MSDNFDSFEANSSAAIMDIALLDESEESTPPPDPRAYLHGLRSRYNALVCLNGLVSVYRCLIGVGFKTRNEWDAAKRHPNNFPTIVDWIEGLLFDRDEWRKIVNARSTKRVVSGAEPYANRIGMYEDLAPKWAKECREWHDHEPYRCEDGSVNARVKKLRKLTMKIVEYTERWLAAKEANAISAREIESCGGDYARVFGNPSCDGDEANA